MKTLFETLTVVALFFVVTLSTLWILHAWTVNVNGVPVGLWAPALGLIVGMVLAIGLVVGSRFDPVRRAETPVAAPIPREVARDITRATPKSFTVKQGRRYRADIRLGFFEQVASNDMIAGMLEKAGFADVSVSGSGGVRKAEATWPGKDTSADMPAQIVSAVEIGSAATQVAAN